MAGKLQFSTPTQSYEHWKDKQVRVLSIWFPSTTPVWHFGAKMMLSNMSPKEQISYLKKREEQQKPNPIEQPLNYQPMVRPKLSWWPTRNVLPWKLLSFLLPVELHYRDGYHCMSAPYSNPFRTRIWHTLERLSISLLLQYSPTQRLVSLLRWLTSTITLQSANLVSPL